MPQHFSLHGKNGKIKDELGNRLIVYDYELSKMSIKNAYIKEDLSVGKKDKKYKRTIYSCVEDDVWITTEIPEEKT